MKPGPAYAEAVNNIKGARNRLKKAGDLNALTVACDLLGEARERAKYVKETLTNPHSKVAEQEYDAVLGDIKDVENLAARYASNLVKDRTRGLENEARGAMGRANKQLEQVEKLKAGKYLDEDKVTDVAVGIMRVAEDLDSGLEYASHVKQTLDDHGFQHALYSGSFDEIGADVKKLRSLKADLEGLGKTHEERTKPPF